MKFSMKLYYIKMYDDKMNDIVNQTFFWHQILLFGKQNEIAEIIYNLFNCILLTCIHC